MKKIKILMTIVCVMFMALGMVSSVSALTITPATTPLWSGSDPNNPDATEVADIVGYGGILSLLYKQDVPDVGQPFPPEEGSFASSYETAFLNDPYDPQDAIITYISGPVISGSPLYLLVKDGNQTPIWYIFDLNNVSPPSPSVGWDGTETLEIIGFWPDQGAISHVSIYGTTTSVPEPTTLLLLGLGLVGLAGFRKR
jgi:hypothetical protein